jgi:hypothetical protein
MGKRGEAMTVKIFLQHGWHHRTVKESLQATFLLFFSRKTGKHHWVNIKAVKEWGVPAEMHEVEFESMEQAQELFEHHPEVKRQRVVLAGGWVPTGIWGKYPHIGDRSTLKIGKTDKWTSV